MAENSRYVSSGTDGDNSDLQNPRLTGRGKLRARMEEPPLQTLSEEESPWILSLDGDWKFSWYPAPGAVPAAVYEPGFKDTSWGRLPVPSNWEMHGHGVPQYNNVIYPYSHDTVHPPAIDPDDNPTGVYRTAFSLPDAWRDRLPGVVLRFEGIRSAAHVYLNGDEVGYTQNSYSPAEFRIGPGLKKGRNQLTVVVCKWCAGTYLEDQDMWRLGGLFRSVSLLAPASGGISDVFARCRFDSSFSGADLTVDVTLDDPWSVLPDGRTIRWYLFEEGAEDVIASSPVLPVSEKPDGSTVLSHSLTVHEPRKWSADEPNLYRLAVELSDPDGTVADIRSVGFGFRQVDIVSGPDGAVLQVNGRPVKLRGVNRHEIHPVHGQAVPADITESDLILMKRNNINAVRCSHYPNSRIFYELTDRLGLYVIDEANLESHGLRASLPASLPEWTDNCVDRIERMVLTHRNHPSIILWSLGNEAGHGRNFRKMKEAALVLDQTRPIHYEGDHKLDTSDVFSLMYPNVKQVDRIGRRRSLRIGAEEGRPAGWWLPRRRYRHKPFIMCEFSHAMGNSLGNFAEYMELVEKYPNIAGGFIWDFADQALMKKSGDGTGYLAYGGEFGEQPHDGVFCADGIVDGMRRPQPELEEVRALYSPVTFAPVNLRDGFIEIRNRLAHSDLQRYEIRWTLERDGMAVAEGSIRQPDIPPGTSREVNIFRDLAAYPGKGEGFLNFSVCLKDGESWAEAGFELCRQQIPVPELSGAPVIADPIFEHLTPPAAEEESAAAPETVRTDGEPAEWRYEEYEGHLIAAGAGMGARFSLHSGSLVTLDFGKGNIISSPLEPDFFRAVTVNESAGIAQFVGESMPDNQAGRWVEKAAYRMADFVYGRHWKRAVSTMKMRKYRIRTTADGLTVRFFLGVKGFIGPVQLSYRLSRKGELVVSMSGVPGRELIRFGTRLAVPSRYRNVSWFGRGPHASYIDRKTGAPVSRYEMDAGNLHWDYLMPQESGNRTDVRRVSFSDGGSAITFRGLSNSLSETDCIDFSAGFATREAVEDAGHAHEVLRSEDLQINIDGGQRGVGGAFPGVLGLLGKYKMKAFRRYRFSYAISRETPGATSAAKKA